jgi:hypothetical protein
MDLPPHLQHFFRKSERRVRFVFVPCDAPMVPSPRRLLLMGIVKKELRINGCSCRTNDANFIGYPLSLVKPQIDLIPELFLDGNEKLFTIDLTRFKCCPGVFNRSLDRFFKTLGSTTHTLINKYHDKYGTKIADIIDFLGADYARVCLQKLVIQQIEDDYEDLKQPLVDNLLDFYQRHDYGSVVSCLQAWKRDQSKIKIENFFAGLDAEEKQIAERLILDAKTAKRKKT